jgi:hypothetical protein
MRISGADGITIDGGTPKIRQGMRGNDVFREDASQRGADIDSFIL